MVIGIDANWCIYEKAGIGKYTENIIKALLSSDSKHRYILYFNFFRQRRARLDYIYDLVKNSKADYRIVTSWMPAAWREKLMQFNIPFKFFYPGKIDLFYSPFFAGVPKNKQVPTVVTIHDLVFKHFPEHRGEKLSKYYLDRTINACQKADKIIAVSATTKKDLINILQIPEEKIVVSYEGADKSFKMIKNQKEIEEKVKQYIPKECKYILTVGTLEPRKNLIKLLEAYAMLPYSLQDKYKLVIIGGKGWNNSPFFTTLEDLNLKEKVILTGFVKDEDLPYLYNRASLFVYPSLYEGFGLPPLEAMSCGLPVIVSDISSLPEVVGAAGVLVSPKEEKIIAQKIKAVLTNPILYQKLHKRSLIQSKKFSWVKAARELVEVFDSLAIID